ncbi:hypothetical protein [Succinimonas sp.]|uniref:hypothetical protein n=2 Tax=Succinimonas sp. TaxID=1936151 RepID=UPI0038673404
MTGVMNSFETIAREAWLTSRDVVVNEAGDKAQRGNLFFSAGREVNDNTMRVFRQALSQKYGVFGEHAFDTVVGARSQMHKSLRVCDIRDVLSSLETVKKTRLICELNRQLDTDPKMLQMPLKDQDQVRDAIRAHLKHNSYTGELRKTEDLSRVAASIIKEHIENHESLNDPVKTEDFHEFRKDVSKELGDRDPAGLRNLSAVIDKKEGSVEDRVKSGVLGAGQRINRSSVNPMLFQELKSNGVEPGFIYTNDWSANDTRGLMADYESEESLEALEKLKNFSPALREKCAGKTTREQIMLCGRSHPACMSAVAEFIIEREMEKPDSRLYQAFMDKRGMINTAENWQDAGFDYIKKEFFAEIRDAIMAVNSKDPDYESSPVFKHFTDRHITKLDYNESARIVNYAKGSEGKFMRPERIITGRKFGQIYRLQTATTADKSSAGAVTEALANDLSRLAGVPTQELRIVRGKYSDGHPKLMLEAKFAKGYQDMEKGFIKDGQIVTPEGQKTEKLGKYKAFFLVTADRDAVGSRGQNKGFKDGKFFAIDPGHSLEKNGRFLEVDDNLNFKDTFGFSTKPRFKNFSVFDDDTRFEKFKGVLELRDLKNSEKTDGLFREYLTAFNPDEPNISAPEKQLREQIKASILEKQKEFNDSLDKILTVSENQLHLYDDLAGDGPEMQEKAIETIENLEKLTSPTTWVSPNGEVALKHLSVIPQNRMPWRAHVDGDNIVYHCDKPLNREAANMLRAMGATAGVNVEIDAEACVRITVSRANAGKVFEVFSEKNVAKMTHPDEASERQMGGNGLTAAKNYSSPVISAPAAGPAPDPSVPPFPIPDDLDVEIGNERLHFIKKHYETMIMDTPPAERPRSVAELKNLLACRIQKGREIIKAVYAGQGHRYETSLRNAACVTLAFHAATVKKGEYNDRGAFSVQDPDGYLYQWLDKCKEVYLRTSTHARAYHHKTVDGHMNMPRGIDIPRNMGGLMGGMRTFHYFSLPAENREDRRLFLKCETHGIYNSTISDEEIEKSRVSGMQVRRERPSDKSESMKHCMSLVTSIGRRGPGYGNRKEIFPKHLANGLSEVQDKLRKAGFVKEAEDLAEGVAGKANGGIRALAENADKVVKQSYHSEEVYNIMSDFLGQVENYANETDEEGNALRSGRTEGRIGNEVMLDMDEF